MVEPEIFRFATLFLFKKLTEIPSIICKTRGKIFKIFRSSHHGWAAEKILFSRTSKTYVSSLCEYTFNINIGRKNINSQWLTAFRKMRSCNLSLQRGGNFNNL